MIVPYLRGYGTMRFLSDATMRNGQASALALDVVALIDALRIEKIAPYTIEAAFEGDGGRFRLGRALG